MSDTSFRDRASSDSPSPLRATGSSGRHEQHEEQSAEGPGRSGHEGGAFAAGSGGSEFLKQQGRKMAEPMLDAAREMADRQKAAGVEQIGMVARAVHGAASEIESQSPRTAALIHETANSLERASSALRHQNVDQLADAFGRFARTNPAAFFAGTVVAGFALARFLKSSAHRSESSGPHPAMRQPGGYPTQTLHRQSPGETMEPQSPVGGL